MTNLIILFVIIIILIIWYLLFVCEDSENVEGFASRPKWNSDNIGFHCNGEKKASMAKRVMIPYPDGMQMENIQCVGDNKPPTKCWIFNNTKNSYTCDDQINGDCVKLLNGDIVCSNSPDQSFIFTCNGNMNDPECQRLYGKFNMQASLKEQGYSCNYGNGLVPLMNNNNVINGVMLGTNVLRSDTHEQCVLSLNNSPANGGNVICDNGKFGEQCVALFNASGISTWRDLGFDCWTIEGNQYIGRLRDAGFEFASYDGINPIQCIGKLDFPLEANVVPINCQSPTDANRMCPVVFKDLNLYATTNPLTIRANDIHQSQPLLITDSTEINRLTLNNISALSAIPNFNPNTTDGKNAGLSGALADFPTRVACCARREGETGNLNAPIHVAINPNDTTVSEEHRRWKYEMKNLTVPADQCPANMYSGSSMCNAFYDINCANQLANFKTLGLPMTDFPDYSPECACYAPKLPSEQQYSNNIPPKCYKANCGQGLSYLDPVSRTGQCNLTICTSIVNAGDIRAGGTASLSPQIQNQCGNFLPPDVPTNNPPTPTNNNENTHTTPAIQPTGGGGTGTNTTPATNPLNPTNNGGSSSITNNTSSSTTNNTTNNTNSSTTNSTNTSHTNETSGEISGGGTNTNNSSTTSSSLSTSAIVYIVIFVLFILVICGMCLFMRKGSGNVQNNVGNEGIEMANMGTQPMQTMMGGFLQ